MAHVNNARYLEFMQDARVSLIHEMGLDKSSLKHFGHYVARNEIDYVRPIDMNDHIVHVDLWVSRFGGASYDVRYEIFDEHGNLAARAKSVMVMVDVESQQVMRVPEDVRAAMAGFHEPDGD